MKTECYCYTRGEQPDYRDFCIPRNIGKEIVSTLHNMVTPILEWGLNTPRWVLYRHRDVIVWGICCKNELLSVSCNVDVKGRSVKGFFAIVCSDIDEDNICIPSFDLNLFRELYEKEVASYWYCQEGDIHYSQTHSFEIDNGSVIYAKGGGYSIDLNTDIFRCVSLGSGDKYEVVAAALSYPEISLLIDNEEMAEATGKKEPFMNCLSSHIASRTVRVKRICPQCRKYVDGFSENGVCIECEKENIGKTESFENGGLNEMEQSELEKLKRKLRDSEFYVEELDRALTRERRINKILWIVCAVFLLAIAYLWHNSRSDRSIVEENMETVGDTVSERIESQYELEVFPEMIDVPATGKESVVITWRSNLPRMKTVVSDNDWIKGLSEDATSITFNVEENTTDKEREAIVEFVLGEQKKIVKIEQAAR